MFKCEKCKKQSEKGETQFTRKRYRILRDTNNKKCGKEIIFEQKICSRCYNKYGGIFKT